MNICLLEQAAHLLQQEMESQALCGQALPPTPAYLA
jgi:hypothetical protein